MFGFAFIQCCLTANAVEVMYYTVKKKNLGHLRCTYSMYCTVFV